ncbi:hypothetical protein GF374_00270 [Candidatus Woesearchaeota archaeon]|nr:hypothetical protein [Candidatus Woesearchaeota archaeon]
MKNKKKIILVAILALVFMITIPQAVSARKGVGIVWGTETVIVSENSVHCVEYGLYNPWDEDVLASLTVDGDLKQVVENEESETKLIKANTLHDDAIPVELCFKIKEVYEKDCAVGEFLLCEQDCDCEQVSYSGEISVIEEGNKITGGFAGSKTALGVTVPLKLKVKCEEYKDYASAYVIVIAIVLMLIGLTLYKRRKKH